MEATIETNGTTGGNASDRGSASASQPQPQPEHADSILKAELNAIRDYRLHVSKGNHRIASAITGMAANLLEHQAQVAEACAVPRTQRG